MGHPYADLVNEEAKRAEEDLTAFRSRALTVVTTSSGVITLLTGVATFAASQAEEDAGFSGWVTAIIGVALLFFVVAAAFALLANAPGTIERPGSEALKNLTSPDTGEWTTDDKQHERKVAAVNVKYLISVREVAKTAATHLQLAIGCQIAGLLLSAIAGFVAINSM